MIRPILAAGSLTFALGAFPAAAQPQSPAPAPPATQPPPPDQPAQRQVAPIMVGLAVYSSDGQKVGEVVEVGAAGSTQAVRVEMGEFLGLGATSVIVNANALALKADRAELSMTADEIKETISKQRQQKQEQRKQQ